MTETGRFQAQSVAQAGPARDRLDTLLQTIHGLVDEPELIPVTTDLTALVADTNPDTRAALIFAITEIEAGAYDPIGLPADRVHWWRDMLMQIVAVTVSAVRPAIRLRPSAADPDFMLSELAAPVPGAAFEPDEFGDRAGAALRMTEVSES